jgi:hypothetical protein
MVCGWCGLAGNFRDSHIVAFLRKVMVVRDTSVRQHWRIPRFAGTSVRRSDAGISTLETITNKLPKYNHE